MAADSSDATSCAGSLTGSTVHGYELGALLGSGAFSEVYRTDPPGSEPIAVKAVRLSSARPEQLAAEIALLSSARHPSVVRYLWHELGSGPLHHHMFIATELCDHSLKQEFDGHPPGADRLDHARRVVPRMVTDALSGLAYLHQLEPKVIHRDIKPANILLSPSGVWRVADFGIARLLDSGAEEAPNPTLTFTPAYMPPDPIRHGSITPAADIFSLGATVQWAFTGELPWPPMPATQLIAYIRRGGKPLTSGELPDEWLPFVSAALDVNPTSRIRWNYTDLISWQRGNHPDPKRALRSTSRPRGVKTQQRTPVPRAQPVPDTTVDQDATVPDMSPTARAAATVRIAPVPGGPGMPRTVAAPPPTSPEIAGPLRAALCGLAIFIGILIALTFVITLTN